MWYKVPFAAHKYIRICLLLFSSFPVMFYLRQKSVVGQLGQFQERNRYAENTTLIMLTQGNGRFAGELQLLKFMN